MFACHFSLNGTEIDHTFHLKPLLMASIFHDTFARLTHDLGVSAIHLQPLGLSWVLSDMHIEYMAKLPFWRDEYEVAVWIRRNQQVRIFTDFVAKTPNGQVFARGTSIWLVIDSLSRQPVMNPEIFDAFEIVHQEAVHGFRFGTLPVCKKVEATDMQTVKVNDLDFNRHLNSVKYLGGGIELLGSQFLLSHTLKSVTAKYLKEVLCDEKLLLKVGPALSGFVHHIFNQQGDESCRFFTTWESL